MWKQIKIADECKGKKIVKVLMWKTCEENAVFIFDDESFFVVSIQETEYCKEFSNLTSCNELSDYDMKEFGLMSVAEYDDRQMKKENERFERIKE